MKSKRNKSSIIILLVGVLLGLGIILYPLASQIYYDIASENANNEFREALEATYTPEQKEESLRLAEAYNEALEPNLSWVDPYSSSEREEGVIEYANMLEVQERIGIVSIPSVSVELPIYAGTSETVLQKGAGHLEGTSLPVGGENTHSVVTAHRGLADKRLFRDLDKVAIGDIFYIESMAGTLYYEVDQIQIVEPTQTDTVMIVPGEDYATLLTCDPYMINSHRLLIRGTRIADPVVDEIIEEDLAVQKDLNYYLSSYWHYISLIGISILAVLVFVIWNRIREKKNNNNSK